MSENVFGKLMAFLDTLEQRGINYTLARNRDDALMVNVAVPGERWEIEFLGEGAVEVERFISDGDIYGEEVLHELFARYMDDERDTVESPQEVERGFPFTPPFQVICPLLNPWGV
jgi:hypothetical protein